MADTAENSGAGENPEAQEEKPKAEEKPFLLSFGRDDARLLVITIVGGLIANLLAVAAVGVALILVRYRREVVPAPQASALSAWWGCRR